MWGVYSYVNTDGRRYHAKTNSPMVDISILASATNRSYVPCILGTNEYLGIPKGGERAASSRTLHQRKSLYLATQRRASKYFTTLTTLATSVMQRGGNQQARMNISCYEYPTLSPQHRRNRRQINMSSPCPSTASRPSPLSHLAVPTSVPNSQLGTLTAIAERTNSTSSTYQDDITDIRERIVCAQQHRSRDYIFWRQKLGIWEELRRSHEYFPSAFPVTNTVHF